MNPVRIVYEDAPATIPVPADMRHRRVEATFWPLDEPTAIHADHDPTEATNADKTPEPRDVMTTPSAAPELPDLAEFRATLPMQTVSAGDFCRAMRNETSENLPPLTRLIGQARGCFERAEDVNAFIRAERDAWDR